jgi:hypothetical protein
MILLIDKIDSIIMSTEKNNDIVRKRQEDIDAKKTTTTAAAEKNNEIEETLNTVSYKDIKESKKETSQIGDSDRE